LQGGREYFAGRSGMFCKIEASPQCSILEARSIDSAANGRMVNGRVADGSR
jgi:hypothetical protein